MGPRKWRSSSGGASARSSRCGSTSPRPRGACSRERGFEGVTVAEVAREADVAEQTVYNYFPTKEDQSAEISRDVRAQAEDALAVVEGGVGADRTSGASRRR